MEYLYEAPLAMEREKLADVVLSSLRLENRKPDLSDWEEMVESLRNPNKTVKIAIVGKYTQLHDAYLSVVEALKHGGISCRAKVELEWIDSEELTEKNLDQQLHNVDGILVPGGFGNRGTEGMILAAQYARVHKIPYLGICLGMQMAIVEFARHVLGYEDANSIELNPETKHPVIALMPDQEDIEDIGGTLRLGSYPCVLDKSSKAYALYGEELIHERHRHRYEVNNDYRDAFRGTNNITLVADIVEHLPDTLDIVMQRPLAKFEFITNDLQEFIDKEIEYLKKEAATRGENAPTRVDTDKYKVVFHYSGFMPNTYNINTDKPIDSATGVMFESRLGILNDNEASLGFDYVFVNGKEAGVSVQIGLYDGEDRQIALSEPIDVSLRRSYHTILRGSFLMQQATGGIVINPDFDGNHNIVID
mgnify:CR=1 FL=1